MGNEVANAVVKNLAQSLSIGATSGDPSTLTTDKTGQMDNGSKYPIWVFYEILSLKCYLELQDIVLLIMIHLQTPGTLLRSEPATVTA